MNDKDNHRIQLCMAWTGPIMIITYLICWIVLGHNLPPPSPGLSGAELVANYYGKYREQILPGMAGAAVFGLLYLCWSVQMTVQMWRREAAPILSILQLMGGSITAWILAMCPALWAWCARYAGTPGVDPELTKAVHIFSWYIFDLTYLITTIQHVSSGVFAILDKTKPALFPAWAGWLSIVVGIGFVTLSLVPYFNDGPFAMNGLFNLFVLLVGWALWILIYSFYMIKDLQRTGETSAFSGESGRIAREPSLIQAKTAVP